MQSQLHLLLLSPQGEDCSISRRPPRISDEMLERHIRQYIDAQTRDEVVFSWQGGEPTLLGLDFFSKVVELEALYKKPHQRVENDLQTNGISARRRVGSVPQTAQLPRRPELRWPEAAA